MFSSQRPCPPGVILLLSVKSRDLDKTCTVLATGISPNETTDARGQTALHLAAIHGHAPIARALLHHGASTECMTPGDLLTPLRLAAQHGHLATAQVLLDFGANASARDAIDRATPLHAAAEAGHTSLVLELAARGANLEARAVSGQTPLRWALSLGRADVVAALLKAGADPDAPDRQGASCLHGIAALGTEEASVSESAPSGIEAAALAAMLLASGAEANFSRAASCCPSPSSVDFVSQEIDDSGGGTRGGDGDCNCGVDSVGETPLHIAARESSVKVVEALLEAGANPNAKTSKEEGGLSPLHYAAAPGGERRRAVVRLLLEAGADLSAIAGDGVTTPLRLACLNSALACVEELLRWDNEDVACFAPTTPNTSSHLRSSVSSVISGAPATPASDLAPLLPNAVLSHSIPSSLPHGDEGFLLAPGGGGGTDGNGDVGGNAFDPPHYSPRSTSRSRWPHLEDVVGLRVPEAARDPIDDDKIRLLLKRAPADRAWRRRGWLVMLYHRVGSNTPGLRHAWWAGVTEKKQVMMNGLVLDEDEQNTWSRFTSGGITQASPSGKRESRSALTAGTWAPGTGSRPLFVQPVAGSSWTGSDNTLPLAYLAGSAYVYHTSMLFANKTPDPLRATSRENPLGLFSNIRRNRRPVVGDGDSIISNFELPSCCAETKNGFNFCNHVGELTPERGGHRHRRRKVIGADEITGNGAGFINLAGRCAPMMIGLGGKPSGRYVTDAEVSVKKLRSVVDRLFEIQGDESILRRVVECL